MSVPFTLVPGNVRVPFFWGEIDGSQANVGSVIRRTTILGQRLSTGTVPANTPVPVSSYAQAAKYFGIGSVLSRMVRRYLQNDKLPDLWCVGLTDNGAGVQATTTLTFTGPATEDGTVYLYAHGERIPIAIGSGDSATTIAAAAAAAVTATPEAPFTAASVDAVCTLTFRHKGEAGNGPCYINYMGVRAGEFMPAGVGCTVANTNAFASGATNPDVTNALGALNDDPLSFLISGVKDSTNRGIISTELADRWDPTRQLFGQAFYGYNAGFSTLVAADWDDRYACPIGYNVSPTPEYEWVSAVGGQYARAVKIDPSMPLNGIPVYGVVAPREADAFSVTEQNALLEAGITPYSMAGGRVLTNRGVTSFVTDNFGLVSEAFRDLTTIFTNIGYFESLRARMTAKFGRVKIVDSGTPIAPGAAAVTVDDIKAEVVAHYTFCERELGWVENSDEFAALLAVERNPLNPNRVDMLVPPDIANPLYILAMNQQFRLQYPPAA